MKQEKLKQENLEATSKVALDSSKAESKCKFKKAIKSRVTVKRIAVLAVLSALSSVLYAFNFPLAFMFPGFLKINFSMLPILFAVFLLGWTDAILVAIIRGLIGFFVLGSHTSGVGEIADVCIAIIVILSTALVKHHSDNFWALLGTIIGSWILAGVLTNVLINIPLYTTIGGMTIDMLVGACSIIPGINEDNFMLLYITVAVIPFNALISIILGFVTLLCYKRLEKTNAFNL